MSKEFKRRIKAFRTHRFLKASGDLPGRDLDRLDKLSNVELAAAALNPDHSDTGRAAAERKLQARGGSLDDAEIIVPGFVKPGDVDHLRRRFFGASRAVRKYSGMIALFWFIAIFIAAGVSVEAGDSALEQGRDAGLITETEWRERGRRLTDAEIAAADPNVLHTFSSETRLEDTLFPRVAGTPAGQRRELAEVMGFVCAAFVSLFTLLWILASAFRRQPARVLLLRKFNDKKLAKSMEYVITDELRPFGHIVTLSDKHIRRSRFSWLKYLIPTNFLSLALIFIWLPLRLVMRQFNRSKHGAAYVGSARDYRHLAKRLRDRMALNLEVAMTSKEAFIVRTDDAWWKRVILLLMNSADVIVVDLSNVTQGTQWELERLDALGFFERAVLTVRADRIDTARAAVDAFPTTRSLDLHPYSDLGDMVERSEFREAMLETMSRTVMQRSAKTG